MSDTSKQKSTGLVTDLGKLTIGIGSGVANLFFPGAGLVGPVLNFTVDRFVKRPQQVLVDEMRAQQITELSEEKQIAFVPMAYRYFEAAKEGEYEHNLRVLSAFIANELKQDVPDVPAVSRMARRLEGLTKTELQVIALINVSLKSPTRATPAGSRTYVSAPGLANDPDNREGIDGDRLIDALAEIASRGLLIPDGASRTGKEEEYYCASQAFGELICRAEATIEKVASEKDDGKTEVD
ncbi:MAG TPA: hypothetical protein VGC77_08630 [Rhodopseudomonas sp.]|uniref:hypothetical protein n=1 Tax=Rhodopseudomonas sp. TaxID=1078 RepID=UPI002ED7CC93